MNLSKAIGLRTFAAIFGLAVVVGAVRADDRFWIGSTGGDWFDQSRWSTTLPAQIGSSPATVPGTGDKASFMIGGLVYTVGFVDDVDLMQLEIPSDQVAFDLQNHSLVVSQTTHIGDQPDDIGALTLQNGIMTSPGAFIGFDNGDGRLVVDASATLNIINGSVLDQTLAIGGLPGGFHGVGRLDVLGTVNAQATDSVIGARLNGIGIATVDGGAWHTDESLVIGQDGAEGSLTISNGGTVSTDLQTYVGRSGRTNEFVDVTGRGELTITNGMLNTGATATIGSAENAFGEVDMAGINSTWNIAGFLFVGESGIGNLHVRSGSNVHVQNDSFISVGANEGLLNITTAGSFLNDGSMYVGGSSSAAGGPGHLLVQSDGSLVVGGCLKVWETGTLTLENGSIITDCFEARPGATLNLNSGTLAVNGGPFTIPTDLNFGGNDPFDPPEIILLNGAIANVEDFSLGGAVGTSSSFNLDNATINATDDVNVGGDDAGPLGQGVLSVAGGNVNAGDLIRIWETGAMNVESGVVTATDLSITGGLLTVSGTETAVYIDESGEFPEGIPGIYVGFAPAFTEITAETGGKLLAPDVDLIIAADQSSLAVANVSGPESELVTRDATIGGLGNGTLNVIDEAAAEFRGDLHIASGSNAAGNVYLENVGTHARCKGNVTVGGFGEGMLHLAQGSSFLSEGDTNVGVSAAVFAQVPGTVIVEGAAWTNEGSIFLGGDELGGDNGAGEMFIRPGGAVENGGTLKVWPNAALNIEGGSLYTRDLLFEDGSAYDMVAGSVEVDGGQLRLPTASFIVEGPDETSPMNISLLNGADAEITANWYIGGGPGAHGSTTVAGVSQAGARSTLLNTANDSNLTVGVKGVGTMRIIDGGLVDFAKDVFVGFQGDSVGTLEVGGVSRGQRATFSATRGGVDSSLTIGGRANVTGGNGNLRVFDGGLVAVGGDMLIARNAQSTGRVSLSSNSGLASEIHLGGDLFVGGNESSAGGQGSLALSGGGLLNVKNTLKIWAGGSVALDGGTIRANHVDLTESVDGAIAISTGRLEASLISGDVENAGGTLAHGNTVGPWTLDGNYTQLSQGTFEYELVDLSVAAVQDTLDVKGTATLDGTLHVAMHPEFRLPVGERLTVMTFGARVGEFAGVVSAGLLIFDIEYFDDRIELIVVDSPLGPGDLDANGLVNLSDYALLSNCMTGPSGDEPLELECNPTDVNKDGRVDLLDVSLWEMQRSFEGLPDVARWNAETGGNWDEDSKWRGGTAPVAGDRVFIDVPGVDATVLHDLRVTEDVRFASLYSNEKLIFEFNSVFVDGPFYINNTLEMACGFLKDTTIDMGPDGLLSIVRYPCNSAVEGVTINGDLDLLANGAPLISRHEPLTINGDVRIAGFTGSEATGLFFFGANKVLNGNSTISFTRNPSTSAVMQSGHGHLHLTSGITIRGAEGHVGRLDQPMTIDGIIDSDVAGQISVNGTGWINNGITRVRGAASELGLLGSWTNHGTIEAFNEGTLILGSVDEPFQNLGSLTTDNATVHLNGEFRIGDLGDFEFNNSQMLLGGTLINETGLVLDAGEFNWSLAGGTIIGGTVSSVGGKPLDMVLRVTFGIPTLDGVTLNTDLRMINNLHALRIYNGLTLNGRLLMGYGSSTTWSRVQLFEANPIIDGTGSIEFLTDRGNRIDQNECTPLTLGQDMLVRGKFGIIGLHCSNRLAAIINNGTIHSDLPGQIILQGSDWINNGTIKSSGGGAIRAMEAWTNNGIIDCGVDSPFNAVGSGQFEGDFTQSTTGTTVIRIAGPGTREHGRFILENGANLAGTLRVEFENGYVPPVGTQFTVLEYESHVGEFDQIEPAQFGNGLAFEANYGVNSLVLTVVAP